MTEPHAPPSPTARASARVARVTEDALDDAARLLLAGGLVAIPTETVYGLAADATNGRAVAGIFAAKGRPAFNPLICHVSDIDMARICAEPSALAAALMERFWPGPLTLVVPRRAGSEVSELATAGLETIALRMPRNAAAIGLIRRVGRPIAAPSANPSEQLSPTTAQHVEESLGTKIDMILDDGPCPAGVESTIIAVTDAVPVLLRPGALSRSDIEALTGPLAAPDAGSAILSPGMMRRHYAPRAALRLNAAEADAGEAYLGFGPPPEGVAPALNLSPFANLDEAAANLFAMLRRLDATSTRIAVAPIPNFGIGEAINDRLKRAAARFSKDSV